MMYPAMSQKTRSGVSHLKNLQLLAWPAPIHCIDRHFLVGVVYAGKLFNLFKTKQLGKDRLHLRQAWYSQFDTVKATQGKGGRNIDPIPHFAFIGRPLVI